MKDKFNNKDGLLTVYSLACGYVEITVVKTYEIHLYMDGNFHIKMYNNDGWTRILWESGTLSEMRKRKKALIRSINKK